jgi:glycosyltransferase involved in cell wall biosynthesis
MAAGVPVATLGLGALPELIDDGQNGFLAGADDMNTLIKKVCLWKSMSSEARMAMACKARETILAAYSREKIVPQIEELYLQSATRFRCNSPRYAKLSNNH